MPRLARLDAPGILHHVMGRGIERKKIVVNDTDRNDFIDRLAAIVVINLSLEFTLWEIQWIGNHQYIGNKNRPLTDSAILFMQPLGSGSRRRNVTKARGSISWIAVREPQRCKSRRASESRRRGWRRSTLLRTLDNAESEVLRRSRRVNNMARSIPSFEFTVWDFQKMVFTINYWLKLQLVTQSLPCCLCN